MLWSSKYTVDLIKHKDPLLSIFLEDSVNSIDKFREFFIIFILATFEIWKIKEVVACSERRTNLIDQIKTCRPTVTVGYIGDKVFFRRLQFPHDIDDRVRRRPAESRRDPDRYCGDLPAGRKDSGSDGVRGGGADLG